MSEKELSIKPQDVSYKHFFTKCLSHDGVLIFQLHIPLEYNSLEWRVMNECQEYKDLFSTLMS